MARSCLTSSRSSFRCSAYRLPESCAEWIMSVRLGGEGGREGVVGVERRDWMSVYMLAGAHEAEF